MTTTSADPDDLVTYVEVAGDGTTRLTAAAADLRGALDAFRVSEGRSVFLADVPEVDLDLSFLARRWDRLAGWLDLVAQAFTDADEGEGGTLTLDDQALAGRAGRYVAVEVEAIERDGRLILDTGVGHDDVVIDDRGGHLVVSVNGTTYMFDLATDDGVLVRLGAGDDLARTLAGADRPTRPGLVLDGGSGDDQLVVAGGSAVLRGGSGDDELAGGDGADRLLGGTGADDIVGHGGDDRIIGAGGDDTLDGNAGDDWVSAGAGDDLVYGETGADLLTGGGGRDHLDGGGDVDHVDGGSDDDVLSGGGGADTVGGGTGDDVAYAGPGHDLVTGGSGADAVHVEPDDVVGDATDDDTVHRMEVDLSLLDAVTVDVAGPLADRIRSDLVTLASTEAGSRLLASLRGRQVTVVGPGTFVEEGDLYHGAFDAVQYDPRDDEAGFGAAGADRPADRLSYSPLVSLAHELIHASHDVTGTRVDGIYSGPDLNQLDTDRDGVVEEPGEHGDAPVANEERATVGLPVDHDEDPSTPDVPASAAVEGIVDVTENDLRDELGLETRGRY
jgi:Ca2+-binding RTX toxin-like protein